MIRKEAEALKGQRVRVWTAANGTYVGILEEVFGSPWRGKVRITGILEPAQHFERGSVCRRGFRVGEHLEVGGSSIRPTEATGSESYLEAVEAELAHCRQRAQEVTQGPNAWVYPAFAKALEHVAKAEARRLETGQWSLKLDQ